MEWSIGFIAKKRAILTPDKLAICFADGENMTYKEMNDGANRVAHYLQDNGIKKGDRISALVRNCPEFLHVYFAAAKLGLVFAPLNFRLVARELEYELNNCESRFLLFHDSLQGNFEEIRDNVMIDKDKFLYLKCGDPDCPECPKWASEFGETVRDYPTTEPEPDSPVNFDDPLAIIYTSGTTGDPKGAVVSHRQTYFKNFQITYYYDMRADDIYLAHVPLFHSGGLFVVSTPAFCIGATVVTRSNFDAEGFASDMANFKATIVLALPTMWKFILETGGLDKMDVSHIRVAFGGGERTPASLLQALADRGLHLKQGFGQTENSAMMMLPKDDIQRKQGSIGKPGFFTEVWIRGKDGKELPPHEIGEIVAKGPTVMSGYWEMPEKTAEAIEDGMLHTGDLGYVDEEGFFYIVDREKDMYRSGGENVYPAEAEKILVGHPKIMNAAIIGVPDEKWGEAGMAFIVLKEGQEIREEEIKDFLKGKLARYKFPKFIKVLDELPVTSLGKIKKVDLKKQYGVRLNED